MTIPVCILPVVLWSLQSQLIAHLSAPPVSRAVLHYSAKPTPPVSHSSHPQLGSTASLTHPFSRVHSGFCHWGSPGCIRTAWQGEPGLAHSLCVLMAASTCGFQRANKLWEILLVTIQDGYSQGPRSQTFRVDLCINTTTWHPFPFFPCVGTVSVFLLLSLTVSSSYTPSLVT